MPDRKALQTDLDDARVGADAPDAVLAAVDAIISGEAADAAAEARARKAGWR